MVISWWMLNVLFYYIGSKWREKLSKKTTFYLWCMFLFNPTRSSSHTRTRGLRMDRIGRVRTVWVSFVLDPMTYKPMHRSKIWFVAP